MAQIKIRSSSPWRSKPPPPFSYAGTLVSSTQNRMPIRLLEALRQLCPAPWSGLRDFWPIPLSKSHMPLTVAKPTPSPFSLGRNFAELHSSEGSSGSLKVMRRLHMAAQRPACSPCQALFHSAPDARGSHPSFPVQRPFRLGPQVWSSQALRQLPGASQKGLTRMAGQQ